MPPVAYSEPQSAIYRLLKLWDKRGIKTTLVRARPLHRVVPRAELRTWNRICVKLAEETCRGQLPNAYWRTVCMDTTMPHWIAP